MRYLSSQMAPKMEISGPVRNSSTSMRPSPKRLSMNTSFKKASADAASGQTATPFPAARPSNFSTVGYCPPKAATASSYPATALAMPVGMRWRSRNSLANSLEASSWALSLRGPQQGMPSAAQRLAIPSPFTRQLSSPATQRSILLSAIHCSSSSNPLAGMMLAVRAMASLPGWQ